MRNPSDQLQCSFCGKGQRQVRKLIAGPDVLICDECIDLCNEIIGEEFSGPEAPKSKGKSEGEDRSSIRDLSDQLQCSFCKKGQRQVRKLIAGPGVYICDECIDLCNEIIEEEFSGPEAPKSEGEAAEIEREIMGATVEEPLASPDREAVPSGEREDLGEGSRIMRNDAAYFGIDFGTTNSSMAWYNPELGRAEIILNSEGEQKTPSLIFFGEEEGEILVGKPVEDQLELAGDTDDPQEREEIGCRVVKSVKRSLLNPQLISIPGREPVRPVDVVALILGKLKRDAQEGHFYEEIERVVITCPAIFGSKEREVLLEAAEMAGFGRAEVLEEPTAAAIAFSKLGQKVGKGVLVYDLGAGTFDLSVVARREEGSFYAPMEPEGDDSFGGDDLDLALYRHCDGIAWGSLGRPISPSGKPDLTVLRQCRSRKESFSTTTKSRFVFYLPTTSEDGTPERFRHEMTRETFEGLVRDRIEGTVRKTARLLERAASLGHEVETVVLIGGSSQVPLVKKLLAEALPVEPRNFAEKDYAVALGAAYHAFELWGRKQDRNVEAPLRDRTAAEEYERQEPEETGRGTSEQRSLQQTPTEIVWCRPALARASRR